MTCKVEVVDDWQGANHRVVAIADVESGPEICDGRSTAPDLIPRLDEQCCNTRSRQVGGSDEAVVSTTNDDRVNG